MAIKQVRAKFDGQWYDLEWNEDIQRWECRFEPERTSYGQPDGQYSITLEATNEIGETVTVTGDSFPGLTLTVRETVPPVVTIEAPAAGYVTESSPVVIFTVTDDADGSGIDPDTLSVTSDSDAWPGVLTTETISNGYRATFTPSQPLADGLHVIAVSATDHDGNQAEAVRSVVIDTTPPTLAPAHNRTIVDWETMGLTGHVGDVTASPVTLQVTRNGQDLGTVKIGASGDYFFSLPLEIGENFVTLIATDKAGLVTSKDLYIIRLITDRTQADVDQAKQLAAKGLSGMTDAERAEFLSPVQRGAYRASDMNRVRIALEWLSSQFKARGYFDPYQPVYNSRGDVKWETADELNQSQAEAYTANIARVRETIVMDAPAAPDGIKKITVQIANDIEAILVAPDVVFGLIDKGYFMAGETMAGEF